MSLGSDESKDCIDSLDTGSKQLRLNQSRITNFEYLDEMVGEDST